MKKLSEYTMFPNLHGRGVEIDEDFMQMIVKGGTEGLIKFSAKYGKPFCDLMFNNFFAPVLQESGIGMKNLSLEEFKSLGETIANKRGLFIAAFID